jgi:hypothetical protein
LENVAKLNYFGTTLTNQNRVYDENKRRLNSEIVHHQAVKNPLSSCLVSKSVNSKINNIKILTV